MARLSSQAPTLSTQPDHAKTRPAVLVTGASGGIGRAISLAFGGIGWHVGVHYSRNKPAAETTLRHVQAAGGTGDLYQADIRKSESVQIETRLVDLTGNNREIMKGLQAIAAERR